jgi:RNA polymerase sigma-70 factor (ECF subfamily)
MKVFVESGVNIVEHMNTLDSSALIEKCLAGDEQAIEWFVRTHEANVFRLAYSMAGDAVAANEITQETFISALKSLHTYKERSPLKAWLYTITLNTSRSYLRKRKTLEKLRLTLTSILKIDEQVQPSLEDSVVQTERDVFLARMLEKLDEKHRLVIVLRYFQELSVTEISEILSLPEGTVHSRLHTARERLRDLLSPFDGE